MKNYKEWCMICTLFLIGCAPAEPISKMEITEKTPDTTYIEITAIPNDDLPEAWAKIDSLKKENHLLRVEIDDLKEERKVLEALLSTKKSIKKLKSTLSSEDK